MEHHVGLKLSESVVNTSNGRRVRSHDEQP